MGSPASSGLLTYIEGDATAPIGDGLKVIAHVVNDQNLWGAGFVLALSKRWNRPQQEYHAWFTRSGNKDLLGALQLVPVEPDIYVANIVGQHGVGRRNDGVPPIRYDALNRGFGFLAQYALGHPEKHVSIHAPRLGCGLAGGSWSQIEPLLEKHFVANHIPVTVYDFPGSRYSP